MSTILSLPSYPYNFYLCWQAWKNSCWFLNSLRECFEAIPPCFNICTWTVGANLAISICSASDVQDRISGTDIGIMLFSSDQTLGILVCSEYTFLVPLHSRRRSFQTSQIESRYRHYPQPDLILLEEVVVNLRQLHAAFLPHEILSFDFAASSSSCPLQFLMHHAVQTHTAHQLPSLLQVTGGLLDRF